MSIEQPGLIPGQDLQADLDGPPGSWIATGQDPQFFLPCHLPAGWARIGLKMTSTVRGRIEFYSDSGQGFNRAERLERTYTLGKVDTDFFVYLPRPVRSLRFDPIDTAGRFYLEGLRVEAVSALRAWGHALRATLRRLGGPRRILRGLGKGLALLCRGRLRDIRTITHGALNRPDLGAAGLYDEDAAYQTWRHLRRLTELDREKMRGQAAAMTTPPRISLLLPLTNAGTALAATAIESVLAQLYPHWQLIIAAVGSLAHDICARFEAYARRETRLHLNIGGAQDGGAALNSALTQVKGDYVGLLDPQDQLAEHALLQLAQALVTNPGLDMVYSDEDQIDSEGRHGRPFFKPDWSPEHFLANGYTGRLAVYRTELVRQVGGFRTGLDTVPDFDLALRFIARTCDIGHVADVLYHRRQLPVDTANDHNSSAAAARRALQSYLTETGQVGTVEPGLAPGSHRVQFAIHGRPRVSILIPSACRPFSIRGEMTYFIKNCVASIRDKSTYDELEILLVHNHPLPPALALDLAWLKVQTIPYAAPFNWSAVMNLAAARAEGDHYLFLNDDMEVLAPDWIESLLEFSQQPGIGAVGAKLLFPDGRLQHAGITLLGGEPKHCLYSVPGEHPGYHGSHAVHRNYCAVTGACLMTRAEVFGSAGGFHESFPLNYSDIDYCLRLVSRGLRVVYTPYARLFHYESATKPGTFPHELDAFQDRWGQRWAQDPYYNPNLSIFEDDFRIKDVEPQRHRGHSEDKGKEQQRTKV